MMTESARIVAIEPDHLWVETGVQGGCNSCSETKRCGTSLLAQLFDDKRRHLRVSLEGRDPAGFSLHQQVEIAVEDAAILKGSLVVYCLPLVGLFAAALLAGAAGLSDGWVTLCGLAGLGLGMASVRVHAWWNRANPAFQPMLVEAPACQVISRES